MIDAQPTTPQLDDDLLLQESDAPESPACPPNRPIINRPSDLAHVASPSPTQITRASAQRRSCDHLAAKLSAHGDLLRLTNVVP